MEPAGANAGAQAVPTIDRCGGDGSVLNIGPTIAVFSIMGMCSLVASYVLATHVVDTVDPWGLWIIGTYVVFTSYFMFHYFLDIYSSSYKAISNDKKFYVLSNLIKAGVLASITPFGSCLLRDTLWLDIWHTNQIRNLGCIYAIPDFVSLLLVRRMQWTTICHHICVCIFNFVSIQNNYSQENICRAIVVYAIFSTFAYLVNLLLASRFLVSKDHVQLSVFLSTGSLLIYGSCCVVNWSWQVYYVRRLIQIGSTGLPQWTVLLYCCLLTMIIWDDIVLNRWLCHNAQRQRVLGISQGKKPPQKKVACD